MSRRARLYFGLAFLLTGAVALLGLLRAAWQPAGASSPTAFTEVVTPEPALYGAVGRPAPDFALTDPEGRTHRLSDYRGQVVLLNFYATWCPPCRAEMPLLERMHQEYGGRGFLVLAVNLMESPGQVRSFGQELGLTFPQLLDSRGQAASRFRVLGLPMTFLVGRDGRVLKVYTGPLTERILRAWLPEALAGEE